MGFFACHEVVSCLGAESRNQQPDYINRPSVVDMEKYGIALRKHIRLKSNRSVVAFRLARRRGTTALGLCS